MPRRTAATLLSILALAAPVPSGASGHSMQSVFVESFDGTRIDINVCRPAGASADRPVPIVLTSHGWGGEKTSCLDRTGYFNAGIGFASMSQRGAGSSGGESHVMDPDFEGRDIMAVIDHLASLDWVLKDDGPGGTDPVLGGLGGSYGGGFQWIGAFTDQMRRGQPTRFNALRPGNTWYDLLESLAPNGVMRTVMTTGLYAGGARSYNLAPWIHVALATSVATGHVVDGPGPVAFASEIHQHSAAWFVEQGHRLDIPVFVQQGAADLVFNLNEGLHAFERALTPSARARSIFRSNQEGHNVPAQVPGGPVPYTARGEAHCDAPSELNWFRHTLLGQPLVDPSSGTYRLRTVDGACVLLDELPALSATPSIDLWPSATGPRAASATFAPVASGPLRVAGIPELRFEGTASDPDARLFWGLAVGTSPETARLVGSQWMPTRVSLPAVKAPVTTELGGIVVDVPAGQQLYLVSAPAVDQFLAHSNRTPGVILAENVQVSLPLL